MKYYTYVNTLFIVLPMTIIMALVGLWLNDGFVEHWIYGFLKSWIIMVPIAYFSVLIILPLAKKITDKIFYPCKD
ncbi:DUF2798 domain-containing protein [Aquimarina algicola]|nr:DUF2798 domain-containing protein [Aquimarina algicola]